MKLCSINVSLARTVPGGDRVVETGIFKEPVSGPNWIRRLKLEGQVEAGDEIESVQRNRGSMSVHELLHLQFFDRDNGCEIAAGEERP